MNWMLMPLRRYAEFSGRSRRMEFWMWQVFKFLVCCGIALLFIVMFGSALASLSTGSSEGLVAAGGAMILLYLACLVLGLAIFIPDLAVTVRRLHDTDRSGWWILAPLAPYLVFWVVAMQSIDLTRPNPEPSGAAAAIMFGAVAVAVLLALTLLVFYFLDGTPGANRFGPDPKGRDGQAPS